MTTPPPPRYAPTAGLSTTWWSQTTDLMWPPDHMAAAETAQMRLAASMDDLSRSITETPEQRRQRLRDEDDARREAQGETLNQRGRRHRAEDRHHRNAAQRATSRLWKVDPGERARRFRRWCTLTAASASTGYAFGLVQWFSSLPFLVAGLFVLPAALWLDLRLRGGWYGAARLSSLRGWRPILAVLITRLPFSSALASLLHLDRLLAETGRMFHLIHH